MTYRSDMASFDLPFAPTINEIIYNRPAPAEARDFSFSTGAGLFRVGMSSAFSSARLFVLAE